MTQAIDAQRLTLILNDLRLPEIKARHRVPRRRGEVARSPLPAPLAEHEIAERERRQIERHPARRGCPRQNARRLRVRGRADRSQVPVTALCSGDSWLEKGANLILFGPPGGKSNLDVDRRATGTPLAG